MSLYRRQLPLTQQSPLITDGGLETELIFKNGYELPEFASFPLLETQQGREDLTDYYQHYLEIARTHHRGIILEAPTWRANPDYIAKLGYSPDQVSVINAHAIEYLNELRKSYPVSQPCLISGCIGPRFDGYQPQQKMSIQQSINYHTAQITAFEATDADLVTALTMTNVDEALGISLAAKKLNMPIVISFTTETDGQLPSGESLKSAIETIDRETANYPLYYMINCAHPSHFQNRLGDAAWCQRIQGLRSNASCKSHAELDESTELDSGDPVALGLDYSKLNSVLKNLRVIGGCCGTNHEHVVQMVKCCNHSIN
ncbi:homocysteine S-methyltransferase family protein [Aliikangiella sp. G2MR2-5]|uniref:homocysteine S-methyltransferase family protein n=1 Tax=Aliikangiella sp. G2MR2-5 TaxID=2788943 RepID=UPI0018AA258B|nr:homocysteine S-methyltransferase family protein [Aliikangiella sp. G2MR2-5]